MNDPNAPEFAAHDRSGIRKLRSLSRDIRRHLDIIMTTAKDLNDLMDKFDTATNEVASDLTRLRDEVANGISQADAAPFQARLTTAIDRLTVLGEDPQNPVPPALKGPR